jgi:hypothetical protein
MRDVHVDAILTNMSIMYKPKGYIADRIFPTVPVKKQSDKYYTFPKGPWFRDEAGLRAPGTEAKTSGYLVSTDSYYCEEYALKTAIPIQVRKNADQPLDPDRKAVQFVTNSILMRKERLVASKVMNASNWASGHSLDVQGNWAAGAGNTFIDDMDAGIEQIRRATGMRPNRLLISANTLPELKKESTVLERIKYTERGIVTAALIAAMFELEEVIIGDVIYSSAEEAASGGDFSGNDVWEVNAGKGAALLYYVPSAPAIDEPSAGYVFSWITEEAASIANQTGSRIGRYVVTWWDQARKSDWVEACEYLDCKICGSDLGYLFYDTIQT